MMNLEKKEKNEFNNTLLTNWQLMNNKSIIYN